MIKFVFYFFFFNDTATTEIYTLSLHDALPICAGSGKTRTIVYRVAYLLERGLDLSNVLLLTVEENLSFDLT